MKDIENYVTTIISNALNTAGISASISGGFLEKLPSYPHVYVIEASKEDHSRSTSGLVSQRVMFEVSVFSDKATGAKQECKTIMETIDTAMRNLQFGMSARTFTPGQDRATVRLVQRYTGIVYGTIDGTANKYSVIPQ